MEKTAKKKNPIRVLLIVLACVAGFVALVLLAARIYFRAPVHAYYRQSEKAFVIPGLSDGFIAQGISYDDRTDCFFVTGYMKDGGASPIYIVDKSSGDLIKTVWQSDGGEPFAGHCGGLSVSGDYIYVAGGADACLYVYSYEDVINAADGESVSRLGAFSTAVSEDDYIGAAFTTVADGCLIVGEFYREENYPTPESHKLVTAAGDYNQALAVAFPFSDEGRFGLETEPAYAYSITGLVQGMAFQDGRIYLSTSYAAAFSHVYSYDPAAAQTGTAAILGTEIPLLVLDSACLTDDMKIPPMSEEIEFVDGRVYTMCESASNKYVFGKLTSARWCYATEINGVPYQNR